jgi:hypothetical protein
MDPMSGDDSFMATPIAGRTVAEGLADAEAAGRVVALPDGRWQVRRLGPATSHWVGEQRDASRRCTVKMWLLYHHIYRRQHIPQGGAACFKVKVQPRTLRQLMAVRDIAHRLPYTYKCGLDADTPYTAGLYGAYFYLNGLSAAREAYPRIRQAVDSHPKLGSDVAVIIKRGCTLYEIDHGPSDGYRFAPELAGIEDALDARLEGPARPAKPPRQQEMETFALWIETAYRLGDETYLDFTGGRRLYPPTVGYDPDGSDAPAGSEPDALPGRMGR